MSFNDSLSLRRPTFYMPVRVTALNSLTIRALNEERTARARILIISGGEGMLEQFGAVYSLYRGSVWMSEPTAHSTIRMNERMPLKGTLIEYRALTADGSRTLSIQPAEPLIHCSDPLLRLALELEQAWRQPSADPLQAQSLFTRLLETLLGELLASHEAPLSWLEQVRQHMHTHFAQELSRDQLASLAGVSPEHFSRVFHRAVGQTYNAYLTMLKIRRAQLEILHGATNLGTIAIEVGYKESAYFSRKFKQLTGISPSAYRSKPKRAAALNLNHTACLHALGITPEAGVYTPWLEQLPGVQPRRRLNPGEEPFGDIYAALRDVNPDLIFNYNTSDVNQALLPIAPVVGLPFMHMDWREQFRCIADMMNKRPAAEARLQRYNERVMHINRQLDLRLGARGTAVIWEVGSSSAYCFGSSFGRGCQIVYDDLGFRFPSVLLEQALEAKGYIEMEIEAMPSVEADYIFITGSPTHPSAASRIKLLLQSPQWLALEAVRCKRVYMLSSTDVFFGYDPLSSEAQLQELQRALLPCSCHLDGNSCAKD